LPGAADGEIAVMTRGPSSTDYGMDMATRETVWALPPSSPDAAAWEAWRVNTTLLGRGRSDLFSLVPQSK